MFVYIVCIHNYVTIDVDDVTVQKCDMCCWTGPGSETAPPPFWNLKLLFSVDCIKRENNEKNVLFLCILSIGL